MDTGAWFGLLAVIAGLVYGLLALRRERERQVAPSGKTLTDFVLLICSGLLVTGALIAFQFLLAPRLPASVGAVLGILLFVLICGLLVLFSGRITGRKGQVVTR